MFCSKCGQQITEGSSFCNYCGEQLVRPAVQPARVEPSTDGKAIGSLICGILSVTILSVLAGIPAIILVLPASMSMPKISGAVARPASSPEYTSP